MNSASPSSHSMAPQEHQVRKYDIFVSFRGEDTRYGFLSHLSAELRRKKILTFIDDKLEKGEEISEALFKAIKDSDLSIIIFSEKFASSTWCLKEVAEIIRCRKRMGQMVVPVFYHVDPSHVRKQTGSFAEAFAGHEAKYKKEEVEKWRSALTQAANISGWHQASATSSENVLVEDIVGAILKKLNKISSSDIEGLVGMGSRIEPIESLLSVGMVDVNTCTVGIWGMGGIGKTTVAEVIFQRISNQFEGCYFLANVREEWEKYGPGHLQGKLLSAILDDESLKNAGPNMGRNIFVKDRLRRSKVLIVLDDVDNIEQLEFLAGGSDCFGLGSRIIITTRNKQVLQGRVDEIYEVKGLSGPDALQLFSQYAFQRNHPTEDFEELSNRVANYANGNPLALKVLGAALLCKSKEVWESALNKLEKTPLDEIQKKLRISYDGLGKEEQRIFLDIACFFKGDNKDDVTRILDGCGFHTQFELSILVDKSLIAIEGNKILMHDLLQQMGRAIVFGESHHPGERSRLWIPKEAYDVLRKNKGTDAVEGIILNLSGLNDVYFPAKTFSRMEKLRVLKIYDSNQTNWYFRDAYGKVCKVYLSQGLDFLPEELRCLRWHGYPLKSLPSTFDPENFVDLDLRYSDIVDPWDGVQDLPNLRIINLSYCRHLIKTPDFSEAPNLESIKLEGCTGLLELHPSIGALDNLTELNLRDCKKVMNFPGTVNLKSLKFLYISGWSNQTAIEELQKSIKNLTGLNRLYLEKCESLKSLPRSIFQLKSLEELSLSGCSNLESFPEILKNMKALRKLNLERTAIKELPSSIDNLSGLVELTLFGCQNLVSLPCSISNLKFLKELNLHSCPKLENFPEILENMEALKLLYLDGTAVKELPSSIDNVRGLLELTLSYCQNLLTLPSSISNLKSLVKLDLTGFLKHESFFCCSSSCQNSSCLCNLYSLKYLLLHGTNIESIPACINRLSHLKYLTVNDCERLQSIAEVPLGIEVIDAQGCTSLKTITFSSLPLSASIGGINGYRLHFNFCNCFELDIWSNILETIFERYQFIAIGSGPQSDQVDQEEQGFGSFVSFLAPGSEIPSSFSYRSVGSSITIKVHPNLLNGKFIFFGVCAVLEFKEITGEPFHIGCECILKIDCYEQSHNTIFKIEYKENKNLDRLLMSDHMFVGSGYFDKWSNNNSSSTDASFQLKVISIGELDLGRVRVKECGVKLSYIRDKEDNSSPDDEDNRFPVIQPSTPDDFVTSHQDSGIPVEESPITRMKRCRDYNCYADAEQTSTEQTAQPNSSPLPTSVATYPTGVPTMGYMAPLQGVISMDGNTSSSAATQVRRSSEEEPCSRRLKYFNTEVEPNSPDNPS